MGRWRERVHSVDAESLSVGTFESTPVDLGVMLDKHAMRFTVDSGGSPTFQIQLWGTWLSGSPFMVLGSLDDTEVTLGEESELVVVNRPSRQIRIACIVTSGTLTLNAYTSSGE